MDTIKTSVRTKVNRIIAKMFDGKGEDPYLKNLELADELMSIGSAMVEPILEVLLLKVESPGVLEYDARLGYPVIHLIRTIAINASSSNTEMIGRLLTSEPIMSDGRARRGPLVRALGRLGWEESLTFLRIYKKYINNKQYCDLAVDPEAYPALELPEAESSTITAYQMWEMDHFELSEAIAAIEQRLNK